MNRPQMIKWLHEQASGPMANDPRQVDTCNILTAIRLELERLAIRRQEIDDEAVGYADEIERLRAALAEARGYETMPCDHNSRWLVYGNPAEVDSPRHCLFCEVEGLRAIVDRLPRTPDIELALLALNSGSGTEFRQDCCECDPETGMVPCQYCAIESVLRKAETVDAMKKQLDTEKQIG